MKLFTSAGRQDAARKETINAETAVADPGEMRGKNLPLAPIGSPRLNGGGDGDRGCAWVGFIHGLGEMVKFSRKVVHSINYCHRYQIPTVDKKTGSSRASPMGMRDGMMTHK